MHTTYTLFISILLLTLFSDALKMKCSDSHSTVSLPSAWVLVLSPPSLLLQDFAVSCTLSLSYFPSFLFHKCPRFPHLYKITTPETSWVLCSLVAIFLFLSTKNFIFKELLKLNVSSCSSTIYIAHLLFTVGVCPTST